MLGRQQRRSKSQLFRAFVVLVLGGAATQAQAASESSYATVYWLVFGGAAALLFGLLVWFVRFLLRGVNSASNKQFRKAGAEGESNHRVGE